MCIDLPRFRKAVVQGTGPLGAARTEGAPRHPGWTPRKRCAASWEFAGLAGQAGPPLATCVATFLRASSGMANHTIERFMTRAPHTIGFEQKLAAAHRMMSEHRIRHLPVLESGKLVGMLSQRDLHLIETLRDVNPEEVEVSEAMTPTPFIVSARSSLRKVALEMAEHKYGSAVVMEKDRVVGVFTTIDALRALFTLLDEKRAASSTRR